MPDTNLPDDTLVTVCSACKTSACWMGLSMCHSAIRAGTIDLTVAQLRQLGLEHPSYWIPAPAAHTSDGAGWAW